MSTALSTTYVPLADFLETQPDEGMYLEWCRGVVYYGMSGGTLAHSRVGARMIMALGIIAGDECTVFDSNVDIWVDAAQFYCRADASLVCGAIQTHVVTKDHKTKLGEAITNPVVIVEVLSPTTEARDRGVKLEAYKQLVSLEDYVLISQTERRVEVHHRVEGKWESTVVTGTGSITIRGKDVTLDALYGSG